MITTLRSSLLFFWGGSRAAFSLGTLLARDMSKTMLMKLNCIINQYLNFLKNIKI